MDNSFINSILRRANRTMLRNSILVLTIIAVLVVLSWRYWLNFFAGPLPMTHAQLIAITDLGSQTRYYVTITGTIQDTGYQLVSHDSNGSNEKVEANFGALPLQDKFMIVKTSDATFKNTYTGPLMDVSADVNQHVVAGVERDTPDLKGSFLPFMLDATADFRVPGYVALVVGGVALLLSLRAVLTTFARGTNPASHPIMRGLARFGPLDQIKANIDAEAMTPYQTIGATKFTENWVLNTGSMTLNAMRLGDVIWVYKKVTQHRTNGIPTGKTYNVQAFDRYGGGMSIAGKQNVIDETLQTIYQRAPWIISGYNAELEKAWKTNRQAMIAAVDAKQRR